MKYTLVPALIALLSWSSPAWAQKAAFDSGLITPKTEGHAVDVDVKIDGAKKLYLVVTDGGNGYTADWADWATPRLMGPKGELQLTKLKPAQSVTGWGEVRINQNCEGGPLSINGEKREYGIGTHANSVLVFDLPEGYTQFLATAGIDDGGSSQQGGRASSVTFQVYVDKAPGNVVALAAGNKSPAETFDAGNRDPADALSGLEVADGLEASLFAAEPMLLSPSDIDIDHLGRVWVCEVVNYRGRNGERPEGDRILILEDTNGDGKADKQTVFYQGRDIDSALGICVLDNKVIVSVAPNVFVFTDEDRDGKADKKELLFSHVGQAQHDHSAHAFVFGPDGKLYWNYGNTGKSVFDKQGKPIVSREGYTVNDSGEPYRQGMVFRCNLDGSDFEVLGNNFRNNYEVAVDSFGSLWQSDNDDDGNRGVRINYVMQFGNYGYVDELTGAGWKSPRTGMHPEIPLRHFHQNDPGVVPNLLNTGAGSPTGILCYEGRLLPEVFHDQVIHCDAGPNVVRAYPVKPDGAGYTAEIVNILEGTRDKWFRPSDVCVAPDGSLIIADWYDPGVGGHRMGDTDRGRLFRVAPPGTPYKVPSYDYTTVEGAIGALLNPNISVRYMGWTALHNMGPKAEPALTKVWETSDNPRIRARALHLLARIPGRLDYWVRQGLESDNANLQVTALRIVRAEQAELDPYLKETVKSDAWPVLRESAIDTRFVSQANAPRLWAQLAAKHTGHDRWYLEALGIGAHYQWDACFQAWLNEVFGKWNTPGGRDIVWRARSPLAIPYLVQIIRDPSTPTDELPRYLRAFDFQQPSAAKTQALVELAFTSSSEDADRQSFITVEASRRLQNFDPSARPEYQEALDRALDQAYGSSQFLELVSKFNVEKRYDDVLAMAQENGSEQIGVEAIRMLLAKNQTDRINQALKGKDAEKATATAIALGNSADAKMEGLLLPAVTDTSYPLSVRRQATRAVARTKNGAEQLLNLVQKGELDPGLTQAAASGLTTSAFPQIQEAALKLFPAPPTKNNKPLPPIAELVKMSGSVENGKQVFAKAGTCAKCHKVNGEGKEVGPDLSEIGSKLSRQAMFESVIFPSAGISHNYETYSILLESGNVVTGILVSETDESVSLKGDDALVRTFPRDEIDEMFKQKVSLMPADLQKAMTVEELVDVIDYISTLKKKQAE